MDLIKQIHQLSNELEQHTVEIRHRIHMQPELSQQEYKTSALVCEELDRMGIPYEKCQKNLGVVATINSGKPGKLLMLRADMDALPIQEETGLPYASTVPNVMHACGHDVHTANLLAVADILNRTKSSWSGRVKLAFQPAEERGGGGRVMIQEGLMDELPDACLAMHVDVDTEKRGKIRAAKGYVMASSDSFSCVVHGSASHCASPHKGVDAIYIAANIINALYGILARNICPADIATLNIGTISGGTARNIIADTVRFSGTIRSKDKEVRSTLHHRTEQVAKGVAQAMGGDCEFTINPGYPAVFNDNNLTDFVIKTLQKNADDIFSEIGDSQPEDFLMTDTPMSLGAEDFGFYTEKAPSCLIRIHVAGEKPLHSSMFWVDERYIKLCTRVMATVAANYLR